MKKQDLLLTLLILFTGAVTAMAATVTIPTASGSYIDWNDATLTSANVENNGANIGSTGKNTVATFAVQNDTQQDYILTFATGSKNAATMLVTVTNTATEAVVLNKSVEVVNTGSWTPSTVNTFLLSQLPAGSYELRFSVTEASSYAGNWGKLAIYDTDSYDKAPGTLTLTNGSYSGSIRTENNGANVGWVKAGDSATYPFLCTSAGVYQLGMNISYYNANQMTFSVVDVETGTTEATSTLDVDNTVSGSTDILLGGEIAAGLKKLQIAFASESTGFLINYQDLAMTRVGSHFSKIDGVTITGQTVTDGTDSDFYCQLPVTYDATTTFSVNALYGTVTASATGIDITDNGDGSFTMPTPAMGTTQTVTLTLTPESGAFSGQTTYTLKLFRIGEMSLTAVTVDGTGVDVLDDINGSTHSATYPACYTTAPVVAAVQIDGANATVSEPVISGSTYTYTIHAAIENTAIERDYTLALNNVHIYAATGDEESADIKNGAGTLDGGTWTNGTYTLTTTSLDGASNGQFKLNGKDYTLTVPSDVVVKQFIIKDFANNYAGNTGDHLVSVTSEGATAYIPAKNNCWHSTEGSSYDLVVNIENHTAGTPVTFSFSQRTGQPLGWFQLTTVKENPGTAPQLTAQNVNVVNNHAVVTLTFDREIPNDVNATINNTTVTAEGGSAVLVFPIWNLNYSTEYTMTIAAGDVVDSYDNANAEAINVAVNTEAKPAVTKAAYDYVVSNATELDAALAELKESNKTADAARKTVFLKNGTYTYGTLEGSYQYNVSLKIDNWNNVYNVSLIGESKDGVVIEGTTDGITSSTLNLGNGTGIYVQDMTIRNNYDFPKEKRFKGVSVAVTGGNKAVLKNVAMQACQDTYVTGSRTYLEDCDIYGTVDFICGGGDIFFKECNLILVDRGGDVIVAPNTTSDIRWGYVFQGCTVKAEEGATSVVDKGWDLGRPWQNEPHATFLNTTMEVLPTDNGWREMSTLYTHFYEYNSMDGNGNALDLSVRGNSPTSINTYTPVLTDAEAVKYTVENVLGGTDSWLPTEETAQTAAPALAASAYTLSWAEVDDARCYVIFKDGEYLDNVTTTSYEVTDNGTYTVRAANLNGGLGLMSNEVEVNGTIILDETIGYTPVAAENVDVTLRRTITAGNWSTIVLPFAMSSTQLTEAFGSGVKVGELNTNSSAECLTFTTVTATEANKPYAIKVATDFSEAVISGVTIVEDTPTQTGDNWNFVGTYAAGIMDTGSFYFSNNQLRKAGATGTHSIKPFRAYFEYTGVGNAHDAVGYTFDDDATAITNVNANANAEGDIYTISGKRMSRQFKGINIINGKKYIK